MLLRTQVPSNPPRRRSIGRPLLISALLVLALPVLAGGAGAEPVPVLPPGVSISVNGQSMSGDEGGKLDGCTLAIAVAGLDTETAPVTVGVVVEAVSPTTPEGSPATLVDQQTVVDTASWSTDLVMDGLVAPYPIKANGYHLRVLVSLDGTLAASSVYWLACGAAQDGNPTRILFAVQWQTNDGLTTDRAPEGQLPDGWRGPLRIDGTSQIGSATCTFPAGATELVCQYDNPGHGDQPGLVVPGSPKATYDVAGTGIPAGWSLDATTVGTFVGRDLPRGEDHDQAEATRAVTTQAVTTQAEEGPFVCTHAVRLVQDPAPPTTTTTVPSTTASTAAVEAKVTTEATPTPEPPVATLPVTGSSSWALAGLGTMLVLAGAAMVAVSTRRRRLD